MVDLPEKVSYSQLPKGLQARLWKRRVEASLLKGMTEAEAQAKAKREFSDKRKKGMRGWRFLQFELLRKIDRRRIKLGLAPIHFSVIISGISTTH
jgi:hypothetical protein